MMQDAASLVDGFQRDGFVVVRGLLPRADMLQLRAHAESLVSSDDPEQPARQYVQTAFNAQGAVKLVKASGLAEHDRLFNAVATSDSLVDVVETLLGRGARRFRDVLVVKPARTGGALSYHQDSAYWDVEPKALVSCWIGLGDVTEQGSCLSIVPGTHTREIEHGLFLRGCYEVPRPITRTLRKLVSLAGTGDNPTGTGGSALAWKAKRWILAETTKYVPALFDLQDFRVPPSALASEREVFLPVQAGDVIFFHSLLWHASGPNQTNDTRFAEIITFMGAAARFIGRGDGNFPLARRP
jgi:ectoine hydroxylase-related dioxygenase (phytanoyl-CoA dioxygenase family)